MTTVIDRRTQSKNKSDVNRGRFLDRFKNKIKRAVSDSANTRSIKDIRKGETITIPNDGIDEPHIGHSQEGMWDRVLPGNKNFNTGDRIKRPKSGNGGMGNGSGASDSDDVFEDGFTFTLSKDEFMEIFFEGMELPDLVKEDLKNSKDVTRVRAGYTTDGPQSSLSVIKTMRQALGRKIATVNPNKKKIKELEEELGLIKDKNSERAIQIIQMISSLKHKVDASIFLDPVDLRYANKVEIPNPDKSAVMFCIMDVSGSMGEHEKEIAKRFFILMYLFLTKKYEKIEIVFIKHHTEAKEVSEQEFFYDKESGGTQVSSALTLACEIIEARYPTNQWNIYLSQASDGDNFYTDTMVCKEIMINRLLPKLQHFCYIEITQTITQNIYDLYEELSEVYSNMAIGKVTEIGDIYFTLKDFFKKRG